MNSSMLTKLRKPPKKLGYRGSFLLFLAILNFVFVWSLWHMNGTAGDLTLPWQAWTVWWGITGVVDAVQAFMQRDAIAFTASAALKFFWGAAAIRQWVAGVPYAYLSAMIWWCFVLLILVVSGWSEPVQVYKPPEPHIGEGHET